MAPAVGAVPTGPLPPAEVAPGAGSTLPLGLQYAASETIGAADPAYAMAPAGAGYALANSTNDYAARVDAGGFSVDAGGDSWSLTVSGVGYGGATTPLGSGVATATANRVEYDYGPISQWFVNGPLGLQQGFTLAGRPAGSGSGDPLTIDLALGGNLVATADPSGTSVTLARADGSSSLVYGGLMAYDAAGSAVPARIVASGGTLSILVDDSDAVYPLTVDPYVQQARVAGSPDKPLQYFGKAVAMTPSGTVAAIAATSSPPTSIRGSVYIFTTNGTAWTRGAELTSSDGVAGDEFGTSLALSADGSTLVVGARRMAVSGRAAQGAAYVFRRNNSTGAWSQVSKLTSSGGAVGDFFGYSTAVNASGSIIAVGAPLADVGGNVDQGRAYIFAASSATSWTQAAVLAAPDGAAGAQYGFSIAVDSAASVVAVGAPSADGSRGAIYAYFQNSPTKLTAADGGGGDGLGFSVAVDDDGSFLVAGAPYVDVAGRADQGAAYVFSRSWNAWAQSGKLTAADGGQIGFSVAIDPIGSTVAAGAPATAVDAKASAGAVYVFERGANAAWAQAARLVASDAAAAAQMGSAVAVANRTVLGGAPFVFPSPASFSQGAAYFFRNPPALAVTSNPTNQTAAVGVPVTFTAASSGPGTRTVRWQSSTDGTTWTDVTGATQAWYTFTPAAGDSGKRFRAVFADSDGDAVATTAALLTVVKAATVLSASTDLNPRRIGDPLAITVRAAGPGSIAAFATPTGSVSLSLQRDGTSDAPIPLGPVSLSGGQAVFSAPTLALGTYTITATYAGDGVFNAATTTTSQVVVRGTSTLTAAVPTGASPGQRVTLVATLTASGGLGNMEGGVTIQDNGVPIGFPQTTTVNGVTTATFTTSALAAGTHRYQFVFLGNPELYAATTGVYVLQVGGAASSATISASAAPTADAAGGPLTQAGPSPSAQAVATATVTAGIPTTLTAVATTVNPRYVQWQYRDQVGTDEQYWVNIIDANQAWYTFTPAAAMQGRQYRAVFTDLGGDYERTAPTTLDVASGMAVQVSTSVNPRRLGDPLKITALATGAAPGVGPITGGTMTLTLHRDGTQDPVITFSGTPINGLAAFTIPTTLLLGTYTVTATYSNATFGVATATTSQVVVRGTSTLTADVPTSASPGQRVTLVATLTASGGLGNMEGGVTIQDNGVPIGFPQTTTVNGVTTATFTTSALAAGTHRYQFVFLGNPELYAATTGVYVLEVGSASSSALAQSATAAAQVASATAPAVDAVALADALADGSAKKTRTSSALAFWRSAGR